MRLTVVAPATFAVALALLPAAARAQSAFDQLNTLCRQSGGNCSPNVPDVPTPTRADLDRERSDQAARAPREAPRPPVLSTEQMVKVQLTGMLLEGLFSSLLSSGNDDAARAAAAERQRAEAALLQQRAAQVQQQRSTREAENGRSLEDMASALSDPWVGRPVRPAGPEPVRLDGYGTVGLFDPPANPFEKRPAPPTAYALASERLARLAAENGDVAVLADRLAELEEKLARVRAEAVGLKRDMTAASRELDYHGEKVAAAVEEARERGVSMALDGLLTLQPKALARLGEVQSNSRAWNQLTTILKSGDRAGEALENAQDRLDDAQRLMARRDLKEDVAFLAKRLGGPYYEQGASILASAQNIRDELQAWKGIDQRTADIGQWKARNAQVSADYAALMGDVKNLRGAVSKATGIPAKDLNPGAPVLPTLFGTQAPPNPLD